jgi:hypothetical protein
LRRIKQLVQPAAMLRGHVNLALTARPRGTSFLSIVTRYDRLRPKEACNEYQWSAHDE